MHTYKQNKWINILLFKSAQLLAPNKYPPLYDDRGGNEAFFG